MTRHHEATDSVRLTATEPEEFPYVYRMNGGTARVLESWEHGRQLLHMLGLHASMSFVVVERGDGRDDRWVQALGAPDRMIVEVADGAGPLRVTRASVDGRRDDVVSAEGFRATAHTAELWSAEPALSVVRRWLTTGALPTAFGVALVTPPDLA